MQVGLGFGIESGLPDEEFGRCFPEAFLCSMADSADSTAHFLGNQPLRRTEGALASLSPLGLFSSSIPPFWTSAVLATLSPYNQCLKWDRDQIFKRSASWYRATVNGAVHKEGKHYFWSFVRLLASIPIRTLIKVIQYITEATAKQSHSHFCVGTLRTAPS